MRFKEYIHEVFTSPVKVKLKKGEEFAKYEDEYEAEFEVDGTNWLYQVEFLEDRNEWSINFARAIDKKFIFDVTPLKNPKIALKVFSTVVDLTKQFIKIQRPSGDQKITFSSKESERTRIKLYDKFANWINKLGYKLSSKEKIGNEVKWIFKRIK